MSKRLRAPHLLFIAAPLLGALLLAAPQQAHAVEDELTLSLGPLWADQRATSAEGQGGFGAAAWLEWHLTDTWGLTAGAQGAYHLSDPDLMLPGLQVYSAWLGGLYTLDITTWVPFVSLAATFYSADPALKDSEGEDAIFGLRAGLGVDWRRYRWFSVGAEGNVHAFLAEVSNYPVYVTALLRFNLHFEL